MDILNKDEISKILIDFKPQRLINFAAETHVDFSIENPDAFVKTNISGTYNLLQSVVNYKNSKNDG